jgi:hypothetical protein
VQSILQRGDEASLLTGFLVLSSVLLSLGRDHVTLELVDRTVGVVNFLLGVARMGPGVHDFMDDIRHSRVEVFQLRSWKRQPPDLIPPIPQLRRDIGVLCP